MDRLDVIFGIRALAADVEREALDGEPVLVGVGDQIHRLAGERAKLARQLHHRTGVGHPQPQGEAGVRRVLRDFLDLFVIVVGHQRLVAVELLQRLHRLDRVGVDDLVPDEILPLLGRQLGDVLVDGVKLLHARHVEAAAELVERLHYCRVAVDLHGVVDLHPREMLAEQGVVLAEFVVVDDEQGRAVLLGEIEQLFLVHGFFRAGRRDGTSFLATAG